MAKKFILSLLFILVISTILTACGSSEDGGKTNSDDTVNKNSSDEQIVEVDEQDKQDSKDSTIDNGDLVMMEEVKVKLRFNNEEVIVNMYDNPTSRDLIERLPLTLTFEDFSGFEKMSVLEEGLTTEGAPEGSTPTAGDFAYYAPWQDITIFYDDWSYSPGLIQLGKIESGIEQLSDKLASMNDDFTVTIEKVN